MFKVGDKVVRKEGYRDEAWCMRTNTPSAPFPVLGQRDRYLKVLPSDEIPNWDESYFDLYAEPAAVPKFKVGDIVMGVNDKTRTPSKITKVEFRYFTDGAMQDVRESKLVAFEPLKEITVDGVIYREVL